MITKTLTIVSALVILFFASLVFDPNVELVDAEDISLAGKGKKTGFAVVELYTSQGCSSCPPADRLLSKLKDQASKENLKVLPLSFHVDYWNYLGWKDPHSSDFATARQKSYSSVFKRRGVYTPQAIVNGTAQFVGSNRSDLKNAVTAALGKAVKTEASISSQKIDQKSLEVTYSLKNNSKNFELVIVEYLKNSNNFVPDGENSGSTLSHTNVVKSLKKFKLDSTGQGKVKYKMDNKIQNKPKDIGLIAFLQDTSSMEIVLAEAL